QPSRPQIGGTADLRSPVSRQSHSSRDPFGGRGDNDEPPPTTAAQSMRAPMEEYIRVRAADVVAETVGCSAWPSMLVGVARALTAWVMRRSPTRGIGCETGAAGVRKAPTTPGSSSRAGWKERPARRVCRSAAAVGGLVATPPRAPL